MTTELIEWDAEALKKLKKAPFFIRGFAKKKVEKAAKALGKKKVTLALFEKIKNKEMA